MYLTVFFCIVVLSSHTFCSDLFWVRSFTTAYFNLCSFLHSYHLSTSAVGLVRRCICTHHTLPDHQQKEPPFSKFPKVHHTLGCLLLLVVAFFPLFFLPSLQRNFQPTFCTSSTTSCPCTFFSFSSTFLPSSSFHHTTSPDDVHFSLLVLSSLCSPLLECISAIVCLVLLHLSVS